MSAPKHSRKMRRGRKGAITLFGSRTDIGCIRDHNEDSLVVSPPLFVVADGMGGHAAGEVASEIAVDTIAEQAPEHPDSEALGRAVKAANHAIIEAVLEGRGGEGMGTTCTAAMLEGERLLIAQVGDSRAYLYSQGKLQQLTRDHSLMADMIEAGQLTPEEARTHPNRSMITRALGSDPNTQPDLYEINVESGDRLLLCSDGLSGMVRNEDIEKTLAHIIDPQRCASQLVNQAIAAGGHDNVTVIVANVAGYAEQRQKKMARKTKITIALILLLFVAIVAGAAGGSYTYLNHTAYLIDNNGKVAIYKGVPDSIFGMSFSQYVETSDVSTSNLQPGLSSRLKDGLRVDSVDAAKNLIKQYQKDIKNRTTPSDSSNESSNSSKENLTDGSVNTDKTAKGETKGAASANFSTAPGGAQ